MSAGDFDEYDDRFEDDETWLDDFDDRDETFDAIAEAVKDADIVETDAGTLGAAIMTRFTELKWAARDATAGSRVVNFTRNGEKQFASLFGPIVESRS